MTVEESNKISTWIKSRKKKRLVIVSLIAIALLFGCGILGRGRLLGISPRYPRSHSLDLCGLPEFYTVGDSDYWHLRTATCFNTEDTAKAVYSWYEEIGWSGNSQQTDRLGMTVTFDAQIGHSLHILTKRQILVFDDNVQVISKHELFVEACIPLPQEAQTWESREIGSIVMAFLRTCLR